MRKYILILFGLLLICFVASILFDKNKLILERTTFSDVDEIDTINYYPERHLYIFGLVKHATFGRFSYQVGISKQDPTNSSNNLNYMIRNSELEEFNVTKDYFFTFNSSTRGIDTINLFDKEEILTAIELLYNSNKRKDKLKFSSAR